MRLHREAELAAMPRVILNCQGVFASGALRDFNSRGKTAVGLKPSITTADDDINSTAIIQHHNFVIVFKTNAAKLNLSAHRT